MHKAKYCIVTCIDFRLQKAYADFMRSHEMPGESDIISLAGCTRDLVKPLEEWHRDSLMRQLELSVKLHDPDTIIFMDHQDCGGYAQDGTIPQGLTLEDDKRAHKNWADNAKDLIKQKFPEKNVEVYFFPLNGDPESL